MLKHNQKISCVIDAKRIDDARIFIGNGDVYICQNEFDGMSCDNKLGYKYSTYAGRAKDEEEIIKEYKITFPEKTWDTLAVGDILMDDDSAERKVLAILGDVFLLSACDDFEVAGSWYTKSEAQKFGLKIKSSSPETIEILGKTYDKKKVEEKLKELLDK